MPTLNARQLVALWLQAGGSLSTAPVAVARALAESSGRTAVTSGNPDGGTNVGVWQLDTRGVGAGHTVAQLQDPMTNARLTVKATNGGRNWSEWADNYAPFLPQTQAATQAVQSDAQRHPGGLGGLVKDILGAIGNFGSGNALGGAGALGAASGAVQWPSDVVKFFSDAGAAIDWFVHPSHWVRLIAGVVGIGWTAGGIYLLGHAGGDAGGSGLPFVPRPAALPMGVFLVGAGGVLLFIAFHNLPKDVDSLPALLGYLQAQVKTGGKQSAGAAAADVSTGPMAPGEG